MSTTNTPSSTGEPSKVGRPPPPDVRGFWRILLAVVAPVPALGIAASTAVAPYPMGGESADILAGAAADPGAMQLSAWFTLLTVLTLIPGAIAVIWVCRRRAPRLTTVAAVLTLLGFSAALVLPNEELDALTTAQEGLDRSTVQALNEAVWNQPMVVIALVLFLVGMVIGGILLGDRTMAQPRGPVVDGPCTDRVQPAAPALGRQRQRDCGA